MASDHEEKKEQSLAGTPRPTLPPIRSSTPAGGGKGSLPPLKSAAPAVVPPKSPPATPAATPEQAEATGQASVSAPRASTPAPALAKPAAALKIVKPKQDRPPENDQGIWRMNRKNFLNVAGWMAFFSFLVTATIGALRLMVPRVLYEPPSAFKAGFPDDYIIGEVNEKYKDEFRVWIVREQEGFYALAAICTHLGCTPRWSPSENKFKCPCHGSGYYKNGINFEGPTPRPLERLKIDLADDGQIIVDRNIKFLYEKQEWSRPGSYLKYG